MPQAANGPPKLGTQFYMRLDVPEDEEDGVRRIRTSVRLVRVVNVDVGDDAVTVDLELLPYATDIDPAPDDVGSCACGAAAPEAAFLQQLTPCFAVQVQEEARDRRVRSHPPGTECPLRGLVKSNSITTTARSPAATQSSTVTRAGVAHANAPPEPSHVLARELVHLGALEA